ncbi:hypothetical protein GCM10008083_17080 [Ulvibacter litoralis]|nr:hypothetical protein GCM10008083_17080 [Ulvibacter litoralis]
MAFIVLFFTETAAFFKLPRFSCYVTYLSPTVFFFEIKAAIGKCLCRKDSGFITVIPQIQNPIFILRKKEFVLKSVKKLYD